MIFFSRAQRSQAKSLAVHMNQELGLPPPPGLFKRFVSVCKRFVSVVHSAHHALKQLARRSRQDEPPAHELDEEVGTSLPTSEGQRLQDTNRKYSWTVKHGFFAIMGGFGLHIPPLPDDIRFLPNKSDETRHIITLEGMKFLARFPDAHKDIPDLSTKEIDALGRASAFAKFVVCCQALWFICHTALRLASHLPISLLELNTFAHAACVLLIYLFWWVSILAA